MTITITQVCDSCGEARELSFGYYGQARDLQKAGEAGGWREVRMNQHLCAKCIKRAVERRR